MPKGIRVAPTGVNVQKASTKDLLYTTDAASLKLLQSGTVKFTFTTTSTITASITHPGINYIPAYRVYMETVPGSGKWYADAFRPGGITGSTDPANAGQWGAQMGTQTLDILLFGQAGNTYTARYFIFEDRIV